MVSRRESSTSRKLTSRSGERRNSSNDSVSTA
jgi:hypothetical protein